MGGSKRGVPLATPSRNGPAPAGVCWFGLLGLLRLMELSVFGGGGESPQGSAPERTEVGALRLVPGSVTESGEQVQTGWSLTQAPHQTRHTTARPSLGQAKGYTHARGTCRVPGVALVTKEMAARVWELQMLHEDLP